MNEESFLLVGNADAFIPGDSFTLSDFVSIDNPSECVITKIEGNAIYFYMKEPKEYPERRIKSA